MPHCDLLVWILVTKLAPRYYRKLDLLLRETGRYRELSSWRKEFKKVWRKLEKTPITVPLNDAYRPDVKRWICTCPSFVVSRFLACKHLIQGMHRVPPTFFLEADRYREPPFWRHPSLRPLDSEEIAAGIADTDTRDHAVGDDVDDVDGGEGDDEEENDDDDLDEIWQHDGRTFEEEMEAEIEVILDFAKGLQHQLQFRDRRMLNTLKREGGSFLRLARACLGREKRMNTTRGPTVSTWEKSTSSAMFYRARPARVDRST